MTKIAVLVEVSVKTRVVVDVPEGKDIESEDVSELISNKAIEKVRNNTFENKDYPYVENVVNIEEDTEVPYSK